MYFSVGSAGSRLHRVLMLPLESKQKESKQKDFKQNESLNIKKLKWTISVADYQSRHTSNYLLSEDSEVLRARKNATDACLLFAENYKNQDANIALDWFLYALKFNCIDKNELIVQEIKELVEILSFTLTEACEIFLINRDAFRTKEMSEVIFDTLFLKFTDKQKKTGLEIIKSDLRNS
jgi:hypothetical protein